jgi:ubiquinone/menaquinone biosynthesis C-methylase UbiE
MIEKAAENFKGNGAVHFIRSDAESIPLKDDFFDAVICTNSFHHYLHPDRALREIRRLLKYGGKLYLLDPTADGWFIKCIDKIGELLEPAHVKLYNTEEFRNMFADAGLKYSASGMTRTRQKVHIGEKIS